MTSASDAGRILRDRLRRMSKDDFRRTAARYSPELLDYMNGVQPDSNGVAAHPDGRGSAAPELSRSLVIVIHGPSGVGKDTIIDRLRERTHIRRATSTTSRPPRHYEEPSVHYHFVSEDEFQRKIDAGDFIEYARVYNQWKGVERREVEDPLSRGEDVIIRTDVQGARTWREKLDGAVFIFLMAEDREALKERLTNRGSEDERSLSVRIAEFDAEMDDVENNDYKVVNRHGRLDDAIDELIAIIESERAKPDRTPPRLKA